VCFYNYQQDYQQGFSLTAASSDAFFFNSHILNMNRPIHTEPGRRETGLGLFCLPVVAVSGRRKAGLGLFVCLLWLNSADKSRKFLYMSACTNFWRQTFLGKSYIRLPVQTFGGRHFQENPIFVCLYKFNGRHMLIIQRLVCRKKGSKKPRSPAV
jgi:hypothetical protein